MSVREFPEKSTLYLDLNPQTWELLSPISWGYRPKKRRKLNEHQHPSLCFLDTKIWMSSCGTFCRHEVTSWSCLLPYLPLHDELYPRKQSHANSSSLSPLNGYLVTKTSDSCSQPMPVVDLAIVLFYITSVSTLPHNPEALEDESAHAWNQTSVLLGEGTSTHDFFWLIIFLYFASCLNFCFVLIVFVFKTKSNSIAQADLECVIFLPQPPLCGITGVHHYVWLLNSLWGVVMLHIFSLGVVGIIFCPKTLCLFLLDIRKQVLLSNVRTRLDTTTESLWPR